LTEREWAKILGWPGYRVYRHEINEPTKTLKLWVRRKRANRKLMCSGCGRRIDLIHEIYEREVGDLPRFEFRTTVVIELYRLRCPDRGIKAEKSPQLPSKARFSKRFEDAVRRKPALRQMGVDEMHLGRKQKFLTVVCNLETGEPLWFGRERKKETLDEYFRTALSARQRQGIEQWATNRRIVYDKFHVTQHANAAMDEVRRAEFFRKGGHWRGLVKGKRWLLLTPWVNLTSGKRRELNALFAQVKYRDAKRNVLSTGPIQIRAVP
jgi:transposase